MNKRTNMLIGTMITALLLTTTGTALAKGFDGPGRKGHHHQQGIQAMPVIEKLMHALRRLDLDDQQRENIRAIMKGLKTEARPIIEATRAGHAQLKELIKAETYDANAVAALAEKEGALAAQRRMIASQALSNVFSQLTDEQRDELDAMAAKHEERRAERRAQRSDQS